MTFGPIHRFLLRSIASRGVITIKEAENLLKSYSGDVEYSNTKNLVEDINEEIRPFKQSIKIAYEELTSEEVIVFISLGYDDATKAQNLFSKTELEYFRILLEQIMATTSRQITAIHAINLVSGIKNSLSKTDAQKLLDLWCRLHYLVQNDTNYALGVRAIHEFESYFRQNMPDTIEECCLCKQIVFRGYNCPACGLAVHTQCLNKYLEKVSKWPCCKVQFSQSQLDALNSEGLTQTQTFERTQRSEVYDTVVEPEVHDDDSSMAEEPSSQEIVPEISQRVTRKRKRLDS